MVEELGTVSNEAPMIEEESGVEEDEEDLAAAELDEQTCAYAFSPSNGMPFGMMPMSDLR